MWHVACESASYLAALARHGSLWPLVMQPRTMLACPCLPACCVDAGAAGSAPWALADDTPARMSPALGRLRVRSADVVSPTHSKPLTTQGKGVCSHACMHARMM